MIANKAVTDYLLAAVVSGNCTCNTQRCSTRGDAALHRADGRPSGKYRHKLHIGWPLMRAAQSRP